MTDSSDKRRSKRARVLFNGRIVFNNRSSVLECAIRDISDVGARIAFAHPIPIPPEFELEIPKRGSSLHAQVMWSRGNEHGISFIEKSGMAASFPSSDKTASNPDAPEIQEILKQARRQIADLAGVSVDAVELKVKINTTA